ncbi:MAG: Asp-tRNA(Asn)/Glu-tRNA(Gln) amidotransferase subunit GatC [Candidatus Caenarcaniphilales bacterium]|nr:Asp-tRNA(Asn)/Glu-tRNA(Gln) amidotransferase subunit GatC [Candidatus Caenarcaniphilales bacterium]
MSISKDELVDVANLARLGLPEDSLDKYTSELDSILNYVQRLSGVDTSNVDPLIHSESEDYTPLRLDEQNNLNEVQAFRDDFLDNAPQTEGHFFKVPKIGD